MTRTEIIGECRLILGDCREVLPTLGRVDCVVTDPPYGVKYSSGWDNKFRDVTIANDGDVCVRDLALRICAHERAIVFGSWKAPKPANVGLCLIWDKGTVGMGDLSLPWFPCTEEIYVMGGGYVGTRTSAVMRYVGRNENHPTEKPVPLLLELIAKLPQEDVVCDPFMGSGSTGVACVKMNHPFIGIEIEERYFDIACRRIEAATKEPRLPLPEPKMKQGAML